MGVWKVLFFCQQPSQQGEKTRKVVTGLGEDKCGQLTRDNLSGVRAYSGLPGDKRNYGQKREAVGRGWEQPRTLIACPRGGSPRKEEPICQLYQLEPPCPVCTGPFAKEGEKSPLPTPGFGGRGKR